MNRYYVLSHVGTLAPQLQLCASTCREDAWTSAKWLLCHPGDKILQLKEDAFDEHLEVRGQGVWDSTGYHLIGCVVAYLNNEGELKYLDPINPDP